MKDFQFLDYHTEYSCKGAFKKDMDVEACFSFVFRHTDKENVSDSVTNYAAIAATHSSIIPYDKQMEAIEAACRSMDKNKFTLIGAEPGSGKTQISLGIAESHARKRKHTAYSAIVMCPSTMANEWKENIETVIPFSSSYFVTSLSDVLAIKKVIENPLRHRPVFGIITYGDAKSDYEEKPAYFFIVQPYF